MGSRSHDSGAEIRMHSFTVDCDSHLDEEKVAVVVPVTSVEALVAGSEAMLGLCLCALLLRCLMKRLEKSALQ